MDNLARLVIDSAKLTKDEEIKIKPGCVWLLCEYDDPQEEIEKTTNGYDITYEDAMKWRDYYQHLKEMSKNAN